MKRIECVYRKEDTGESKLEKSMGSTDNKADSGRMNKKVINEEAIAYWLRSIRRNTHTSQNTNKQQL